MAGYRLVEDSTEVIKFLSAHEKEIDWDGFDKTKLELRLPGVSIEIVELKGKLRLMLGIDHNATHQQVKNAIKPAMFWRKRLTEWQDMSMLSSSAFLKLLNMRHNDGVTYAKLATLINNMLADLLYCQATFLEMEFDRSIQKFTDLTWREQFDEFPLDLDANPFSFGIALTLLDALDPKTYSPVKVLDDGLNRIKEGLAPFDPGNPVSKGDVRDILRKWRARKMYKPDEEVSVE